MDVLKIEIISKDALRQADQLGVGNVPLAPLADLTLDNQIRIQQIFCILLDLGQRN